MFDFIKLCNEYEKLTTAQKIVMLSEKSVSIFVRFKLLGVDELTAKRTMAAFIIGSITSDGVVDEREYLFMYPSLARFFGVDFDFNAIKISFKENKSDKKYAQKYLREMLNLISLADEELKADIIAVCLMITAVDGKISFKERRYIKKLIKA